MQVWYLKIDMPVWYLETEYANNSNSAHNKPCIVHCTAQLDLEAGPPALYLDGPCFKHVSAELVYRLK
jgi:hypothetical protein